MALAPRSAQKQRVSEGTRPGPDRVPVTAREGGARVRVAVGDTRTGREATRAVASRVRMAAYSDATLDSYVASGAPLDKAGAYAIQDLGGALVENFAGSYTNVVGLPVEETRGLLAELGVPVSEPAGP